MTPEPTTYREILEQLQYGTLMSDNQEPMLSNNLDIAEAAIKALVEERVINDDEELITPENYAKFSKDNTAIFYENRARDVRNKLRAQQRKVNGEL